MKKIRTKRLLCDCFPFVAAIFAVMALYVQKGNEKVTISEVPAVRADVMAAAYSSVDETAVKIAVEDKGVLNPSHISAQELENATYLPLSRYSNTFIQAEQESGVNAVFLAAVAALESGWGKSNAASVQNNLFGWSNSDGSYQEFSSKEECILYVARQLKKLYLTPGGVYFNGYEVESINKRYNGRECWENGVNQIMRDITHRITESEGAGVNG